MLLEESAATSISCPSEEGSTPMAQATAKALWRKLGVARSAENPSRAAVSATVAPWRPLAAGAIILAGGAGALIYGAVQGELIYVVGTLGLTLFVAGLVDGTGLRYRGAGTGLLLVFASAKTIEHLPRAFQRGVAYGALVAIYGAYVVVQEWPNLRRSTAVKPRSEPSSRSADPAQVA